MPKYSPEELADIHPTGGGPDSVSSRPWSGRAQLLAVHPWIAFFLPLATFSIIGCLEPKPPAVDGQVAAAAWQLPYWTYPGIYTLKIVLTTVALVVVWPALTGLPKRISPWSVAVGIVGVVLWVGLWKLQVEKKLLVSIGLGSLIDFDVRSAYNPLAQLADRPILAYGFLAIRFFGLAVVIALAEELFLRGFLMRYFVRHDWWTVPIGTVNKTAIVAGTLVPTLIHVPAEYLAAAVWFSLVTWLMIKTRSLWDCVVAHGTTNLLLGCYVLWSGDWTLL